MNQVTWVLNFGRIFVVLQYLKFLIRKCSAATTNKPQRRYHACFTLCYRKAALEDSSSLRAYVISGSKL